MKLKHILILYNITSIKYVRMFDSIFVYKITYTRNIFLIIYIYYIYIIIMPGDTRKLFYFYNKYHLGDNILNLKFLYNVRRVLLDNNIHIKYYYDTAYIYNTLTELQQFVDPDTLTLDDIKNNVPGSIELWQGNSIDGINSHTFDIFYNYLYKKIVKHLDISIEPIHTSIWQDEPHLLELYDRLDSKYKNIDILILNNRGQSGQYNNTDELNALCIYLHTKFNIVVTQHISNDIQCTSSDKLTIQDYGAISTHCKYIISVFSGTNSCLFNSVTKESVIKWFMLSVTNHTITSVDCKFTNNISEIKTYFDSL